MFRAPLCQRQFDVCQQFELSQAAGGLPEFHGSRSRSDHEDRRAEVLTQSNPERCSSLWNRVDISQPRAQPAPETHGAFPCRGRRLTNGGGELEPGGVVDVVFGEVHGQGKIVYAVL